MPDLAPWVPWEAGALATETGVGEWRGPCQPDQGNGPLIVPEPAGRKFFSVPGVCVAPLSTRSERWLAGCAWVASRATFCRDLQSSDPYLSAISAPVLIIGHGNYATTV